MKTYNTYDFDPDTPFIPMNCGCSKNHCEIDMSEIKETIEAAINNSNNSVDIPNYDEEFKHIINDIHHIHCDIVNEIKNSQNEICLCEIASKNDIKKAVCEINHHIDHKFDEIDFLNQFDNLNNQLKNIKND